MAVSHKVNEFRCVVKQLEEKFLKFHNGIEFFIDETDIKRELIGDCNLSLPPWFCQPYIRMEPHEHKKLLAEKEKKATDPAVRLKRQYFDEDGNRISRKLSKKLRRVMRRPHKPKHKVERSLELCSKEECVNPLVI